MKRLLALLDMAVETSALLFEGLLFLAFAALALAPAVIIIAHLYSQNR